VPIVAITHAPDYENDAVVGAVREALSFIFPGGLADLVRPGFTVALKVNMLMGKDPGRAITTHPALVRAVCLEVMRCGGRPLIIDSPGGPYTANFLKAAYEKCGFAAVAKETGATLNYDLGLEKVSFATGTPVNSAELLAPAMKADVLINLPKLKTHGLTTMTCAVKNMFGLIPGLTKIEYHMRTPKIEDFCSALVGIAELAAPELTIVDAIEAMEGEGPSGGRPKHLGYILASRNMHALDMVAAKIMGLESAEVPTIVAAEQAAGGSLTWASYGEIEIRGISPAQHRLQRPQAESRAYLLDGFLPRRLADKVALYLQPRPRFSPQLCTHCHICVQSCPPKALRMNKGEVPGLALKDCIRCFCCQELCPEHAIDVQRSWLARLLIKY